MSKRKKVTALIVSLVLVAGVVTTIVLVGNHNESVKRKAEAAKVEKERKARLAKAAKERADAEAKVTAAQDACHEELDPFVDGLVDLDSKINVGMVQADYSEAVRDVSVEYGRITFDDLSPQCVQRVGLDAEKALNRYTQANNIWSDALDGGSDPSESALQEKWSSATRLISHAKDGFDKVKSDTGF